MVALAASVGALLMRRAQLFSQPPPAVETVQTAAGPVALPVRYYNGSLIGAFWLVDPAKAAELLPERLEPLVLPFLGAVAGLIMFEYRNTTIGSYGELGLTVQAVRKGSSQVSGVLAYLWDMVANVLHFHEMLSVFEHDDSGLYVVTLPVTTEGAMAAGREIWGYNKYLAETTSDFTDPQKASFGLTGELEFGLEQPGFTLPAPGLPFLTYTELEDQLMRTRVLVGHTARWGGAVEMRLAAGPTADKLKALGVEGTAPHAVFRTDTLQADLPRGKKLP
eukprot:CAMPEP_0185289612 /NCGR_PEP_ID=MMETSP1363-20130426/4002_1 /TAXON_ID=38817 /ORGANISM="Gephyrocapsa oceanica, Strain RCC1303" /LENGTH=277 /DNA_ID=CAMNT_0027885507 /DNA_START=42 /DNA_END=875 /DNA_ORIENTATION=+